MSTIQNPWDEMRKAISESENVMRAADSCAADAARILVGRLRRCAPYTLKALKRELREFNIHTGEWADK